MKRVRTSSPTPDDGPAMKKKNGGPVYTIRLKAPWLENGELKIHGPISMFKDPQTLQRSDLLRAISDWIPGDSTKTVFSIHLSAMNVTIDWLLKQKDTPHPLVKPLFDAANAWTTLVQDPVFVGQRLNVSTPTFDGFVALCSKGGHHVLDACGYGWSPEKEYQNVLRHVFNMPDLLSVDVVITKYGVHGEYATFQDALGALIGMMNRHFVYVPGKHPYVLQRGPDDTIIAAFASTKVLETYLDREPYGKWMNQHLNVRITPASYSELAHGRRRSVRAQRPRPPPSWVSRWIRSNVQTILDQPLTLDPTAPPSISNLWTRPATTTTTTTTTTYPDLLENLVQAKTADPATGGWTVIRVPSADITRFVTALATRLEQALGDTAYVLQGPKQTRHAHSPLIVGTPRKGSELATLDPTLVRIYTGNQRLHTVTPAAPHVWSIAVYPISFSLHALGTKYLPPSAICSSDLVVYNVESTQNDANTLRQACFDDIHHVAFAILTADEYPPERTDSHALYGLVETRLCVRHARTLPTMAHTVTTLAQLLGAPFPEYPSDPVSTLDLPPTRELARQAFTRVTGYVWPEHRVA